MRFTTFIECYQDWKLTGYNDRYQVGRKTILNCIKIQINSRFFQSRFLEFI